MRRFGINARKDIGFQKFRCAGLEKQRSWISILKKVDAMKLFPAVVIAIAFSGSVSAETVYGSCPSTAQSYQERYESGGRASDLVCYQEALMREMQGSSPYGCTLTAQHYQEAYTSKGRSSDLVCYQNALLREMQ